ncbi:hypothetical protein BVX98_03195 [bacterium F11]|nr:hypothetical protein BVX98_03195 [bacterium F11]
MLIKVNNTYLKIFLFLMVGILFVSCGKKDQSRTPMPSQSQMTRTQSKTPAIAPKEDEEEKPVYVYSGDRFKDPFLEVGQASAYSPEAIFNPDQAKVKGIIYSSRLRSAVLQVSGSGSYFINGSRIIDVMGKRLEGYKAKIFPQKVVISGEEDDVFELKIRETEEDEEGKS